MQEIEKSTGATLSDIAGGFGGDTVPLNDPTDPWEGVDQRQPGPRPAGGGPGSGKRAPNLPRWSDVAADPLVAKNMTVVMNTFIGAAQSGRTLTADEYRSIDKFAPEFRIGPPPVPTFADNEDRNDYYVKTADKLIRAAVERGDVTVSPELVDAYDAAWGLRTALKNLVIRQVIDGIERDARTAAEDAQGWDDVTEGWDDPPVTPSLLLRADGRACAYEGQLGVIGGASEGGKTRLADMATLQEFAAGRPVIRWDLENGPALTRQALRDMGMTREAARELLRYRYADSIWSLEKVEREARAFRAAGGRLVVLDSATAIASALGLETSGGKTADVQELYARALRPWADAGCCALIIDNTNKADPLELTGNQHKRSGVDFGLAVDLQAPHGIGQRGVADVYKIKDRASGIPFVLRPDGKRQMRYVGQLVSRPAPERGGRGVLFELLPVDEMAAVTGAMDDVMARQDVETFLSVLPITDDTSDGRMTERAVLRALEAKGLKMGNSSDRFKRILKDAGTAARRAEKAGPRGATLYWRTANP